MDQTTEGPEASKEQTSEGPERKKDQTTENGGKQGADGGEEQGSDD